MLGLVLLCAAGTPLQSQKLPLWAGACLTVGVLLWAAIGVWTSPPAEREPLDTTRRGPRLVPLLLVAPLAAIAWTQSAAGGYRARSVVPWLASMAFWVWAWWPERKAHGVPEARPSRQAARWTTVAALAVIISISAGFHFYRLRDTPANPTSDHAEKLLDVNDLVRGERPIFFPRNTGREPFQFYWTFFLMELFGLPLRYMTLKIGTAILGVLAIPAIYLLGREAGGNRLGLSAALLAAVSEWPVALARQGLRYPLGVLPTAVVLWALVRYLRRGDRTSWLAGGLAIGFGLHGYVSFRVVPLMVAVVFGLALFDPRRKGMRLRVVGDAFLLTATSVLASLPLLHYMVKQPETFWHRAATRAGSAERAVGLDPLGIFAGNVKNMLLAFNWRGSSTWVVVVQYQPFLDAILAAFLIAGLVLALVQIARGSRLWLAIVVGIFVLTLPSTLSLAFPDENPSINRSGTAIPVIFLIAGLPVCSLAALGFRRWNRLVAVALAVLLALSLYRNSRRYFVDFHDQYDLLVEHAVPMADAVREHLRRGVPLDHVYLLGTAHWIDGRNVALELGSPGWADTNVVAPDVPPPAVEKRPIVFIFGAGDQDRLNRLRELYRGRELLYPQRFPDRNFGLYLVP